MFSIDITGIDPGFAIWMENTYPHSWNQWHKLMNGSKRGYLREYAEKLSETVLQ